MSAATTSKKTVKANRAEPPEASEMYENMQKKNAASYIHRSGINNTPRIESIPVYDKTNCEYLINGQTNCSIVLGKDRNAGVGSGYGGKGFTACAAIDIVAGRVSERPITTLDGEDVKISNNFEQDAARVYVSQLADIDYYLGIPSYVVEGTPTKDMKSAGKNHSIAKSAVALISDHTRVVGRESVIIGTVHLGKTSINTDVQKTGVSIVAGYDMVSELYSLQPMVKGGNLLVFLEKLIDRFAVVSDSFDKFIENQSKINDFLIHHEHALHIPTMMTLGKYPETDIKGMAMQAETLTNKLNVLLDNTILDVSNITEYLTEGSKNYILSKWNKVN